MKKLIFIILMAMSTQLFANQLCTIHVDADDLNTLQKNRVVKLLKRLNYRVVEKKEHANYKISVDKERYFNVHGYPSFFMRKITVKFYSNDYLLYETYSSDGFPIFEALGEVLDDLEVNENFCTKNYKM